MSNNLDHHAGCGCDRCVDAAEVTERDYLAHNVGCGCDRCPATAAPRETPTTDYILPDGRTVAIHSDVARGAASITYTLEGGKVVAALRKDLAKRCATVTGRCNNHARGNGLCAEHEELRCAALVKLG